MPGMAVTAEIKTGEKGGYNQWLTPSMRLCRFQSAIPFNKKRGG